MERGRDVERAAQVLKDGGIIVYPTETLFGLGCDPFRDPAVDRLLEIKGRKRDQGISVAFHRLSDAKPYVTVTPLSRHLAQAFLPGPLTLVLDLTPEGVDKLGAVTHTGTLAVRVPEGSLIQELLEAFGPVTSTSANLHGTADLREPDAVVSSLGDLVDYYLLDDRGVPGKPSTIVDARGDSPKLLREGVISAATLKGVVKGA